MPLKPFLRVNLNLYGAKTISISVQETLRLNSMYNNVDSILEKSLFLNLELIISMFYLKYTIFTTIIFQDKK